MKRRVESGWITKQKYHHGVHRVCGYVAVIAGWRSRPALAKHLPDRSRRRCPFLSSPSLALPFQIQHTRRTCNTMRAKSPMFQIGRSEWVGSMPISDTQGAIPRALSVWERATHTSERYIQFTGRYTDPDPTTQNPNQVVIDDDSTIIMNNLNSKFLRLATCQAWF